MIFMRILAIDTTSHGCSVAVTENQHLVAELNFQKHETHSKHLMGIIDNILNISGMDIKDIDGFAVARGPGSFTGLRIGLSTIKGLAFVTGKPIVGVSSLDALALSVPWLGMPICTLLDARKNEVYMARYSREEGQLVTQKTACAAGQEMLCDDISEKTVFVGTGLNVFGRFIQNKLGDLAVLMPPSYQHIRARDVAELSFESFESGKTDETALIIPQYIRKSDAELNRLNTEDKPALV